MILANMRSRTSVTSRSRSRASNTNNSPKQPPPASYKWGWCTGLEENKAHDVCPGTKTVVYESANYNVGDIAQCGCECHTKPKKQVRKRSSTKSSTSR